MSDDLLDEIKDEVDRLYDIKSPKRRLEAARDLIEYIELHQIESATASLEERRTRTKVRNASAKRVVSPPRKQVRR